MKNSVKCIQCKSKNTVGRLKPNAPNESSTYFCSNCLVEFDNKGQFVAPIKLEEVK